MRAPQSDLCPHILYLGITPYSKDEELTNLVYGSTNLLENSTAGLPLSFSVVNSSTYTNQLHRNTSAHASILPPHFLVSLAYKPNNNTVLRLISVHIGSAVQNDSTNSSSEYPHDSYLEDYESPSNDNISSTEDSLYSSIMLSSTVTYLQRNERYFDIWSNLSDDSYHTLTFIVTNGQLSTCLDGQFRPAEPLVNLWDVNPMHRSVEVAFSTHLTEVATVVSVLFHPLSTPLYLPCWK